MRFRSLLFCALPLLAACDKTPVPVRVDFIGATGLTSGSQRANPGDTLTTKAYAAGTDQLLERLVVEVTYKPGPGPISYPAVLSSFDPQTAPRDTTFTIADTLLAGLPTTAYAGGEFVFTHQYAARTTSGTETWTYRFTDAAGQTGRRALTLTVRNPDSARAYHAYPLRLRPEPTPTPAARRAARDRARAYCNLTYGLVLPRYALFNQQQSLRANLRVVDLIAVSRVSGLSLEAPAAYTQSLLLSPGQWPVAQRRATRLVRTALTATDFGNSSTAADFASAYARGVPFSADTLSSGPLAREQVLAFKTPEGRKGLLYVETLDLGAAPQLACRVRVQK